MLQPNSGLIHCVGTPSFEELLARGLTFWVPTHASQSLVTRSGVYLPFPRTTHVVLPWSWPSHGSYLYQGPPVVAWILHESRYPLLVLELVALIHLSLLLATVLHCRGLMSLLGNVFAWRCLTLGDVFLGRCLTLGDVLLQPPLQTSQQNPIG